MQINKGSNERKVKKASQARNAFHDLTPKNVSNGIISGTLAMTGPPVIILEAATLGNFTYEQTISWMFAVYFFGGLFSIILPLLFKIPITGAHSISGVAFLATVTSQFTYSELIGGYMLSAAIIFVIGITGVFSHIMNWFPKEIIAAMLAGLITTYVLNLIFSIQDLPLVGIFALISYFIFMKFIRRIPAVIGAVTVAVITLFLTQDIELTMDTQFIFPTMHKPEFTILGLFSLAIPLSLLILSNDAAPGIGALEKYQYNPPTRKIITYSGIASFFSALFGGQSANVAGMMTAICADAESGEKEKRYMASVVSGSIILLFGIFAWKLVPFIQALPYTFVMMLAGFALIGVLDSSMKLSFANSRYRLAPIFAFIIALSNVSFFHISAPVWSLIIGSLIAKLLEKETS